MVKRFLSLRFVWPVALSSATRPTDSRILTQNMIAAFIRQAEDTNQSHGLALCANRLLRAPVLKRDLCYRGFCSIAALLQRIEGFDEAERAEMLLELRRKGKSPSHPGLERLLYLIDA